MKKILPILFCISGGSARADDSNLELMVGVKAGTFQTGGNLFQDKSIGGWGVTLKLIPDDFGQSRDDGSWLGGIGWMLSFDLDHLSGAAQQDADFPFAKAEDVQLTWNVLAVYICAGTQHPVQACLGLPVSNSLYLEQNVAGESFNSFSIGNSNPPVFFTLMSAIKPWSLGFQAGTGYWNPTFAGTHTHFNLIQTQIFAGYVF